VPALGAPVLELLAPQPGERVLDLGCGDGVLTEKLVAVGAEVVGVDASPEQIAAAVAKGVDARIMAGQELTFEGEFDAVFSNAALHWMRPPEPVIDGAWRALKPGGRFVAEFGGAGNVVKITDALVAAVDRRGHDGRAIFPWYFPTPDDYRAKLGAVGFQVDEMEHFPRPTPLPGNIDGWLETFAGDFLAVIPVAEYPAVVEEVREDLRPKLTDGEGNWSADYVRLRFKATKPAE
jgi:SAM-dependent methyltransferase